MHTPREAGSSSTTLIALAGIAAVAIAGGVYFMSGNDSSGSKDMDATSATGNDTVQEMVGNPDLDMAKMPAGVAGALKGINKVVSSTDDCSSAKVRVGIPEGWQCRKLDRNANDFTLYTDRNRLNLTIGTSQGMSSCSVLPTCTSAPIELSDKFTGVTKFIQPMIGSEEILGTYKSDSSIKFLVTSNDALSADELGQISAILDSIEEI